MGVLSDTRGRLLDFLVLVLVLAVGLIIAVVFFQAILYERPPREDPTGRVWTNVEKNVNCWYVYPNDTLTINARQEIECIPIMEVGGYAEGGTQ